MIIKNRVIHRRYVAAIKYFLIAITLITILIIIIQKGKKMADRTIYRLTEYNLDNELIKTVYHNHRERAEEEKNNSENESQYIEELNFDANDMNDLCDQLNSDVIEEDE